MKKSFYIIFLIVLLTLFTGIAKASDNIKLYNEVYTFFENGRAEVKITIITDSINNFISVPLNKSRAEDIKSPSENLNIRQQISDDSINYISIERNQGIFSAGDTIQINFVIEKFPDFENEIISDFGNRTFAYNFRNLTGFRIDFYKCELILPENYTVNKIVDIKPQLKDTATYEQVKLRQTDGKNLIELRAQKLKKYDVTSVKFRYKSQNKSYIFLAGIIIAGILYLLFFRNILKKDNKKAV